MSDQLKPEYSAEELALDTKITGNNAAFSVKTFVHRNKFGAIRGYLTVGINLNVPQGPTWALESRSLMTAHKKMIEGFYTYGTLPLDLLERPNDAVAASGVLIPNL